MQSLRETTTKGGGPRTLLPPFLTIRAAHRGGGCGVFLQAGVSAHIAVAVVEVAVPLAAVFAAEGGIPGRDGGVRVALPDGDRPHRLLPVPVPVAGQG